MLEADPIELAGEGDSQLAAHVRECEHCRETAATLLEGQAELAMALDQVRPRVAADEAIAVARARQGELARRRAAWRWLPPIAAAAVLAGLLVLQPFDSPRMPDLGSVAQPAPRIEPLVDAPDAGNIMVFDTGDASVTVIWFY